MNSLAYSMNARIFFIAYIFLLNGSTNAISEEYLDAVRFLNDGPLTGSGYKWLEELCDDYGSRMLGSEALDKAIGFIVNTTSTDTVKCYTEKVPDLPNWIRSENDTATILEPRHHKLDIFALGGTSAVNVIADVIVIESLQQVDRVNLLGKIVVTNQIWESYSKTVKFRKLASKVEKKGAVGLLVSSITPYSIHSLHAGMGKAISTIPAAAISKEEAEMISRWIKRGKKVRINLDISSHVAPTTISSRNVVMEIEGSEKPDEIVALVAHIDSWDVGQGALDDAGGVAAIRQALQTINFLAKINSDYAPKRTIRGIFFTAEEQGNYGANHYSQLHAGKENFTFIAETDEGSFAPLNSTTKFFFRYDPKTLDIISIVTKSLQTIGIPISYEFSKNVTSVKKMEKVHNRSFQIGQMGGFMKAGVPAAFYIPDRGEYEYFKYHHTNADYVSLLKPDDIDKTATVLGSLAFYAANFV